MIDKASNNRAMICDKYSKTGVECGYFQIWLQFICENKTEEQVSKEYLAEQQYMCIQDQHQKFQSILQNKYQEKTEQMNDLI